MYHRPALHHISSLGHTDWRIVESYSRKDGHHSVRVRDSLTVVQSLVAAAIRRVCHPPSKHAFSAWAAETLPPKRMGSRDAPRADGCDAGREIHGDFGRARGGVS
jgi:hypothetical protein